MIIDPAKLQVTIDLYWWLMIAAGALLHAITILMIWIWRIDRRVAVLCAQFEIEFGHTGGETPHHARRPH